MKPQDLTKFGIFRPCCLKRYNQGFAICEMFVDFTHIVAYLDVDENPLIRYLSTKKMSNNEE